MSHPLLLQKGKKDRRAFSLVELLVVCAILGILAALVFSAAPSVIETRNRAVCASNLRQIGALVANYAADNQGQLPESGKNGLFSLVGEIMPELSVKNTTYRLFSCPSDKTGGKNSYSIPENGTSTPAAYTRRQRAPGDTSSAYLVGLYPMTAFPHPSTTFLMVEAPSDKRSYLFSGQSSIVTKQQQFQNSGPYIHGKKGANYLFLDGSVRFINTPLQADSAWPSSKTETYDEWSEGYSAQ